MIKFKEMKKVSKINIIIMWISGIGGIINGIHTKNVWCFLIGIILLLNIIDIYTQEEDKKLIKEYEEMLDKYYDLVGKQNIEIWRLRGEKENDK